MRDLDFAVAGRPKAQRQAHERIIGGRLVANSQKILSLYEPDVRVIVRGKADAEVEFGNTVLVAENAQGITLDYAVGRESGPPGGDNLLLESLDRLKEALDGEEGEKENAGPSPQSRLAAMPSGSEFSATE